MDFSGSIDVMKEFHRRRWTDMAELNFGRRYGMNRKGLKEAIAFETHLSEEQVEQVLCALESIIPSLLMEGQKLHWADLITSYTVWNRPVDHNGRPTFEDKQDSKIRYRLVQCVFSGRVIRSLREHRFNLADKQALCRNY